MMSTEACVLSSLIRRPAHGYELQQLLRRYTDVHSMKKVNVYIVLRALETKGWVSSRTELTESRVRRIYEIAPVGRTEFDRWLTSSIEDPRAKTTDPVMLRILLTNDLAHDFGWLHDAIAHAKERREGAASRYEARECQLSRVVRLAAEEVIAIMDRRLAFLKRILALVEQAGGRAVGRIPSNRNR